MCDGAVSGAKDTASFEVRLNDDRLPPLSSITHEGIFYEHYFDVGTEDEALFSCDWSFASSKDPISGAMEYYVGCGMRGKLDGEGIKKHGRPPVQLSIVLDISGSMGSAFRHGETKNKLDVAKECVLTLIDNLKPTDAFGLVAFDTVSEVVQEMQLVSSLDLSALKAKIFQMKPRGGTDMERGFSGGAKLVTDFQHGAASGQSKRMMFLTDARPKNGREGKNLLSLCRKHSEQDHIYTTFIGLGVDFGVELVDSIAHVKGCNYFTVMSSSEFKKLMEQDFDYVVTPCCFDVDVTIAQSAVRVERVYGSPGNEIPENGLLLRMLSCFPSAKDDNGGTKGGMILAKIAPTSAGPKKQTLELVVTYTDVDDKQHEARDKIEVEFGHDQEHYSNGAIRKAILLTRFVNGMKWWVSDHQCKSEPKSTVCESSGIPPAPVGDADNGYHSLRVSPHYKRMFASLLAYYERTAEQLLDAGDTDDLSAHAKQLVGLIELVSASDIRRALDAATTDDEVAYGKDAGVVDADVIQRRCEEALKADLSAKRDAFETEIKLRLKNVLLARLKARPEDKKQLKQLLSGSDAEAKKAEIVADIAGFIQARPDQKWSEWKTIAEGELDKLVSDRAAPRRGPFFVM